MREALEAQMKRMAGYIQECLTLRVLTTEMATKLNEAKVALEAAAKAIEGAGL